MRGLARLALLPLAKAESPAEGCTPFSFDFFVCRLKLSPCVSKLSELELQVSGSAYLYFALTVHLAGLSIRGNLVFIPLSLSALNERLIVLN